MVWIDIVCLVCVLIFAGIGIWKGLLKSIFHLAAWVLAIAGAYFAQDLLSDFIASNLELSGFTVTLVCICIGFLVPFLTLSFVGHIVHKAVSDSSISKVNRILGALLGALKASIICFVFLSILHVLPVSGNLKDARNSSTSYAMYKWGLEAMGFSSDEIDIVDMAEKKANELTKEIADKAMEKASNAAKEGAEQAVQAAKKNVIRAADGMVSNSIPSKSYSSQKNSQAEEP